jgi:hypothetical protein
MAMVAGWANSRWGSSSTSSVLVGGEGSTMSGGVYLGRRTHRAKNTRNHSQQIPTPENAWRVRTNAAVVSASFFQSLRPLGGPDLSKGRLRHPLCRALSLPDRLASVRSTTSPGLSRNSIASLGASCPTLILVGGNGTSICRNTHLLVGDPAGKTARW